MALPFDSLVQPMTREEVEASIFAVLDLLGVSTTSWKPGAVVRSLIVAVSVLLSACTTLISQIAKSGFLELAEGDWLHAVGHYVYGVDFNPATFAPGQLVLSNSGGGVYDWDPGDLIALNSTTKKTYRNAAVIHLGAGQTGLVAAFVAIEGGSASSAAAGEIDALETTVLGVTVINPSAFVGMDDEADPDYRARCYEAASAISPNGPGEAYSTVCRAARRQDGTLIGVNRVWVSKNSDAALVSVICATPSGPLTGDVDDPGTDLGAVNLAIQTSCVPDGVTATLDSGILLAVAVTYEAWILSAAGITNDQIQETIAIKLGEFFASQPIGGHVIPPASGKVYLDAIVTAIGAASSAVIHVVVTVPAADAPVLAGEIPTLGVLTCTAIHQVGA